MSEPTPVVVPLPPNMPQEQAPAWLNDVLPDLMRTGIVTDPEATAAALLEMTAFGIPEPAVACCALLLPDTTPLLVAVFASPGAGEAATLPSLLVDDTPGDNVIKRADETVDALGIRVFQASRVVSSFEDGENRLFLRGALAGTRPVNGVERDVCLYFTGTDIGDLPTAFWPLTSFLVGDLLPQLIQLGENA
ncbi:hypothetical protein [[Pseudopropionibacterium] massiliense]|uniref:hypothetical protein n=1 Tax=[Pseudopropionibacterium] massiliense TaxID=2220000 RepID=UPI001031BFA9|nr:hypothetical protein [[Pseudopropionibacterium] massiliense]